MVTLAPSEQKHSGAPFNRVEIVGVFGAGKTTLANRLAGETHVVLAEEHERNPFWGDSLAIDKVGYLGYDLAFLIQHTHLVSRDHPINADGSLLICDWSFPGDRLWASLRLGEDFAAYDSIFQKLAGRLGPAAAYLYLEQPPEVIVKRLTKRGREPEAAFIAYVESAVAKLREAVRHIPSDRLIKVTDDFEVHELAGWLSDRRLANVQ